MLASETSKILDTAYSRYLENPAKCAMSDECIKLFDEHGMDGLCFIGFELCTNIPDIEDIMAKSDKEISKYIMDELSRNKLVSILGSKYYQALVYLLILIRNKGISEVLNVLRGNYT